MQRVTTPEQEIAGEFVAARAEGRGLAQFPGSIPATLADAYRVQDHGISLVKDGIGGWKVGRIMPPQSQRFGADRLAGPIFNRSIQYADAGGPSTGLVYANGFAAAEAEFLLRLRASPPPGQIRFTLDEAAALIERVHVGIEIASSPLPTINALGPTVIVSDFGNNNGLVVGPEIPGWRTSDFADWDVSMRVDGVEAGRGKASAFPDGPIGSVRFLLELLASRGIVPPAGTWVSSGAISGVHDVRAGQTVVAQFNESLQAACTIALVPQKTGRD